MSGMEDPKMLTAEQICAPGRTIDGAIAREILDQGQAMLANALENMAEIQRKITALMAGYIPLIIAMTVYGRTLTGGAHRFAFGMAVGCLVVGLFFLFLAIEPRRSPLRGTEPCLWLRAGWVDGGPDGRDRMVAILAREHQGRIDDALATNRRIARHFRVALGCGAATVLLVGISVAVA